jgi:hypothetical protein
LRVDEEFKLLDVKLFSVQRENRRPSKKFSRRRLERKETKEFDWLETARRDGIWRHRSVERRVVALWLEGVGILDFAVSLLTLMVEDVNNFHNTTCYFRSVLQM